MVTIANNTYKACVQLLILGTKFYVIYFVRKNIFSILSKMKLCIFLETNNGLYLITAVLFHMMA